ncbi:MAG TPA: tRNA threonylcarbamoyladenosine dehydratase [Methylotenera sp.]|nr:tRNA threonylcarbamoyladenosine dehydratase [Methylotenera sp.]
MTTELKTSELNLSQFNSADLDMARRFGGVSRLYGISGLAKLQAAHICVIGIGGVGSWAAEAIARNAVGTITLIDLDNIAESNVNRQLHAVDGEFGKAKVSVMAERIRLINPMARVIEIEDFVTVENIIMMLNHGYDGVIDCIDDAKAKMAVAAFCKQNQVSLVTVGGAGGRLDPTRIRQADLSEVTGDRLLAKVRNGLRRDYHFPKGENYSFKSSAKSKASKFGITAIYSDEPIIKPDAVCVADDSAITGLNCAGYGSSVCVTAPFGFAAAANLIQQLLNTNK